MSPGPESKEQHGRKIELEPVPASARAFMEEHGIRINIGKMEIVWRKPAEVRDAQQWQEGRQQTRGRVSLGRQWPPLDPEKVLVRFLAVGDEPGSDIPRDRRGIRILVTGKPRQNPRIIALLEMEDEGGRLYLQQFVRD